METQLKKLILPISCSNDYLDFDHGIIELSQADIEKIRRLADVVKTTKAAISADVSRISMYDYSVVTKKADYCAEELDGDRLPLVEPEYGRIENCKLNVSDICFYWSFYPKHCNDICTTKTVLISELCNFETLDEREVQQ